MGSKVEEISHCGLCNSVTYQLNPNVATRKNICVRTTMLKMYHNGIERGKGNQSTL